MATGHMNVAWGWCVPLRVSHWPANSLPTTIPGHVLETFCLVLLGLSCQGSPPLCRALQMCAPQWQLLLGPLLPMAASPLAMCPLASPRVNHLQPTALPFLCLEPFCTAHTLGLPATAHCRVRARSVCLPVCHTDPLLTVSLEEPGLRSSLVLSHQESSCMRELSILLCKDAMEVAEGTHKMEMKKQVQSTVLPLFFHLHDQNQRVAEVGTLS